jgi:CheY-like chemotaxis protein
VERASGDRAPRPRVTVVSRRRRRVAVLDDEPEFVDLMEEVLGDEGYRCIRTPLAEPIEALAAARADVAIVDLRGVIGEGGIGILERVRADARLATLPLLICSADVQQLRELAGQLTRLPHVALLEKPFRLEALTGVLARLLAGSSHIPAAGGRADPNVAATLEAWLGRLGRSLRWAALDAWVPDQRPGMIRCAAAWVAAAQLEPFAQVSRRTRLPAGAGVPGRVWVSGRATWIEDLLGDLNFPRLPAARRVRLVSAAAVPVMDGDEVVGVVAGYDTRLRRGDPRSLDRLRQAVVDAAPMFRAASGA